ncbi:hypothetical protein HK104_008893 [Borealophlyctis nickersoniae]|nr:hypothetical protein HK104_008893 [Borealophlyctis nickersoniae]
MSATTPAKRRSARLAGNDTFPETPSKRVRFDDRSGGPDDTLAVFPNCASSPTPPQATFPTTPSPYRITRSGGRRTRLGISSGSASEDDGASLRGLFGVEPIFGLGTLELSEPPIYEEGSGKGQSGSGSGSGSRSGSRRQRQSSRTRAPHASTAVSQASAEESNLGDANATLAVLEMNKGTSLDDEDPFLSCPTTFGVSESPARPPAGIIAPSPRPKTPTAKEVRASEVLSRLPPFLQDIFDDNVAHPVDGQDADIDIEESDAENQPPPRSKEKQRRTKGKVKSQPKKSPEEKEDKKTSRRTYESQWWQRKQYACDFKTTNVELFRWHTTHLKVEDQKSVAEGKWTRLNENASSKRKSSNCLEFRKQARAAAAYASESRVAKTKTNVASSSSTCARTTPIRNSLRSSAATAPDVPFGFTRDEETPPELGLLRDSSGRLVMACTAAFAVRSRLERHVRGKDPESWNRDVPIGDYCINTEVGGCLIKGTLGREDAVQQEGNNRGDADKDAEESPANASKKVSQTKRKVTDTKKGTKKATGTERGKPRKPFSFEKIKHTEMWDFVAKVQEETDDTSDSLPPDVPPTTDVILEAFRLAVRNVITSKVSQGPARLSGSEASDGSSLDTFIANLDFSAIEAEAHRYVKAVSRKKRGKGKVKAKSTPKTKGASARALAKALAANTRPTPVSTDYHIDPTQIPYPTLTELEDEFALCLKRGPVMGNFSSTSDGDTAQPAAVGEVKVDMALFRDTVEGWTADVLAAKAMSFVLDAWGTASNVGFAVMGKLDIEETLNSAETLDMERLGVIDTEPTRNDYAGKSLALAESQHLLSTSAASLAVIRPTMFFDSPTSSVAQDVKVQPADLPALLQSSSAISDGISHSQASEHELSEAEVTPEESTDRDTAATALALLSASNTAPPLPVIPRPNIPTITAEKAALLLRQFPPAFPLSMNHFPRFPRPESRVPRVGKAPPIRTIPAALRASRRAAEGDENTPPPRTAQPKSTPRLGTRAPSTFGNHKSLTNNSNNSTGIIGSPKTPALVTANSRVTKPSSPRHALSILTPSHLNMLRAAVSKVKAEEVKPYVAYIKQDAVVNGGSGGVGGGEDRVVFSVEQAGGAQEAKVNETRVVEVPKEKAMEVMEVMENGPVSVIGPGPRYAKWKWL